jgi:acyl-coenzyme A synthetase/AMP-(fatty) acid ligase
VSPIEVEDVLTHHPGVAECGVVGAADQDGLIKPCAFVVLMDGYHESQKMEKELQEFVRNNIAHYKAPRWVRFVEELPRTATGKIQRFRLRERVEGTMTS